VKQEPSDELFDVQGHRAGLVGVGGAVLFELKSHFAAGDIENAPIIEGHPVRVASEVFENSLRTSKRRLAVDHPLDPPEERGQVEESGGFPQGVDLSGEAEKIFPESGFERFEEEPPEQAGEYPDREKEAGLRGNPSGSVEADASSGGDAMNMRMKQQILPPLTENADVPQTLSPDKLTGASAPVVSKTEKKPMRAPR
jgi:hypothetical protein